MRAIWWVGLVVLLATVGGCGESNRTTSTPPPVEGPFSVLDAYGQWIEFAGYGQVWQPRVAYDWQPFIDGRWVWTDRGWLWYSEEPFGWVVYHYGYWVEGGAAGWLWVPGYDWSSARVRWIERDDMIGWSPEPPPGGRLLVASEARSWVMVSPQHFMNRNVGRYRIATPAVDNIPREERPQHQPDVRVIGRSRGRPIAQTRLETERVPAGNRDLIRIRIPDTERDANEPSLEPGATSARAPVLPPAAVPRQKPPVVEPAKRVPPVRTRGTKVDSVKARLPAVKRQSEKEKKTVKDQKVRREKKESLDKKKEHQKSDAFKK